MVSMKNKAKIVQKKNKDRKEKIAPKSKYLNEDPTIIK